MQPRKELAQLVVRKLLDHDLELTPLSEVATHVTDAILAAGWREPARVVSTVEDIEALPFGAVLLDAEGYVWQLRPADGDADEDHRSWTYILDGSYDTGGVECWYDDEKMAKWVHGPYRVLHEGGDTP